MDKNKIDILMITYNRTAYTKLSLARLLDTCDNNMRVWVWHNGMHKQTLQVVQTMRDHPQFFKFRHSIENKKLSKPTNWLWQNSDADYLTKIDDDCLMPYGWADVLRSAHKDNPHFGVIGCWRFPEEDFCSEIAQKKIQDFMGGHKLMRNCWVEGSGYLMKKECFEKLGPLKDGQGFTNYCISLARLGYINGWYFPFLYQEHFDDPKSSNTMLKVDEDMQIWAPLSAIRNGITTIEDWSAQLRRSARLLQEVSYDVKYYIGWRKYLKNVATRLKRLTGNKQQW